MKQQSDQYVDVIETIRADRTDLARVLAKHAGIRTIVEELYPDRAHFLYELLQNAEDCGATEVVFELHPDQLVYRHNGRPFAERDFWAITDIGDPAHQRGAEAIGQFGIGFKAVFAYTASPIIRSGRNHIQIREMVLPNRVDPVGVAAGWTQFEFPFNSRKKTAAAAYDETEAGLCAMTPETLLFLRNIATVTWSAAGSAGWISREELDEHQVRIDHHYGATLSQRYLRFQRPVEALPHRSIAIAWPMRTITDTSTGERYWALGGDRGSVSVYFPAEKEQSGFRFHLHAPFVPEMSRASIKDLPANDALLADLGDLAVASLPIIRDMGLLNVEFLDSLPNSHDTVPPRYWSITEAVRDAFRTQPLTPTVSGSYLPAKALALGDSVVRKLAPVEDLGFWCGRRDWVRNAPLRNSRADVFLRDLGITEFRLEQFLDRIYKGAAPVSWGGDKSLQAFLASRDPEWHRDLLLAIANRAKGERQRWTDTAFLLTDEGGLGAPKGLHLGVPGALVPGLGYVHRDIPAGPKRADVHAALTDLGVRTVGESDRIRAALRTHYGSTLGGPRPWKQHLEDLRRFIAGLQADPGLAQEFKQSACVMTASGSFARPGDVVITQTASGEPTGLQGLAGPQRQLAPKYRESGLDLVQLHHWLTSCGAASTFRARRQPITDSHPEWVNLVQQAPGGVATHAGTNSDWANTDLATAKPGIDLAYAIWRGLSQPGSDQWLVAAYRKNARAQLRTGASTLVHQLSGLAWVPQRDGRFVRPEDAVAGELPSGFVLPEGHSWPRALKFGEAARLEELRRSKAMEVAVELGFGDAAVLQRAQQFAKLPPEEQQRILTQQTPAPEPVFPDRGVPDPGRLGEKTEQRSEQAQRRESEKRTRKVDLTGEQVREVAAADLREVYTQEGRMFCQACQCPVPFAKLNGEGYFEAVQVFGEDVLPKHHQENYLALCANHAAMFRHANGSAQELADLVLAPDATADDRLVHLNLGGRDVPIRFDGKHLHALQVLLRTAGEVAA